MRVELFRTLMQQQGKLLFKHFCSPLVAFTLLHEPEAKFLIKVSFVIIDGCCLDVIGIKLLDPGDQSFHKFRLYVWLTNDSATKFFHFSVLKHEIQSKSVNLSSPVSKDLSDPEQS